jgi:hypothetical protein
LTKAAGSAERDRHRPAGDVFRVAAVAAEPIHLVGVDRMWTGCPGRLRRSGIAMNLI